MTTDVLKFYFSYTPSNFARTIMFDPTPTQLSVFFFELGLAAQEGQLNLKPKKIGEHGNQ